MMKLKQSLYTLLVASSVVGFAHADVGLISNDNGDLDVYGVLDAAVVHQNHSLSISPSMPNQIYPYQPTAQGVGGVSGLLGGGLSDSRLGFKGDLKLGNGAKAIFNLESGFDLTSGQLNNAAGAVAANPKNNSTVNADSSLNGQLFGRAAWFGYQDNAFGKMTAGLQNNPMKDVFAGYDPVKSDTFSPFGESGTVGGGGGVSEDARMENSLEYTNGMNGFDFSLAYQFGNNTSTNGVLGGSGVGNGMAARLGYEDKMFGVQVVFNKFVDALRAANANSNTPPGGISLQELNTKSWLVAAKFTGVQDLNLSAGWEQFTDSAPTDKVNISSIWGLPVSAGGVGSGNGVVPQFTSGSQKTNIYFAGGDYNLMPQLNMALGYYDTQFDKSSDGSSANGSIKTTSAVLDYKLYKKMDTYLVLSANKFGGQKFSANNSSQTAVGLGARLKF